MTTTSASLQTAHGRWVSAVLALTVVATPVQARFDPADRFQLNASIDEQYDNNLFRLAADQPSTGFARSDWLTTPQLQAQYQNTFSRQQLRLDAAAYAPRFANNSQLNYQGYNGEAVWSGRVGDLWHPGAQYRRSRTLASFADVPLGVKDMIDEDATGASLLFGGERKARLGLEGRWGNKHHDTRRYLDLQDRLWAATLGWRTTRGSDLGLRHERRTIRYDEQAFLGLDRDYQQQRTTLQLNWPVSDKLVWKAHAGYLQWDFDADAPGRYASIGGSDLNWQLSDKLALTASAQRDADEPGDNLQISMSNRYRLVADWAWSDKVTTELSWQQQRKHYGVLVSQLARKDETDSVRAQCNWSPWSALTASLYWQGERRDSSAQGESYRDQLTGATLELRY